MAAINAADVAKLRHQTGAGMMDCKKALTEANGDLEAATDILRKKGAASAEKKASRAANEGVIAKFVADNASVGTLVEINCETDFVAKNETFQQFSAEVAQKLTENPDTDLEAFRQEYVVKIGENIKIARHQTLKVDGVGGVSAYIHTGSKVGVLVEIGATKEASISSDAFKQLAHDVTLQIAAAIPTAVTRDEVDSALVEKEKSIFAEQVQGKPAQVVEKIVEGKLDKWFQSICLVDQPFVKNSDETVSQYVARVGKDLDDTLEIRRFIRFQVGETAE
jgi:elongation factor Ts